MADSVRTAKGRAAPARRLVALDALRGLCVLLMLVIGNFGMGPGAPRHLTHAGWNGGVHLADVIFPWFMYCVGVAVPYSAAAFRAKGLPDWRYDLRILRRALLLFWLGVLVSSVSQGRFVISVGVLQLIAVAYAGGALLYDLPLQRRLGCAIVLLVTYWVLVRYVPVPGLGEGAFGAGGNIVHHINETYLSPLGLKGLPLVIPATALVLLGTVAGDWIRRRDGSRLRTGLLLLTAGALGAAIAYLWNLSVPFNRPLWTSSFVLLSAGTATLLLGALHILSDAGNGRRWVFPLNVLGSNAILAYVAPIVFKSLVLRPLHISTAGWTRVLAYTALWWLVMWLLYRKKLFLRV